MNYVFSFKQFSLALALVASISMTLPLSANSKQYPPSSTPEEVLDNLEKYLNTSDMDGILSLFTDEAMLINQPGGDPLVGQFAGASPLVIIVLDGNQQVAVRGVRLMTQVKR